MNRNKIKLIINNKPQVKLDRINGSLIYASLKYWKIEEEGLLCCWRGAYTGRLIVMRLYWFIECDQIKTNRWGFEWINA